VLGQGGRLILPTARQVRHDIPSPVVIIAVAHAALGSGQQTVALLLPGRRIVFLTADAAKLERVKQAIAPTGRVELPLQGQQPALRPLQRGVD